MMLRKPRSLAKLVNALAQESELPVTVKVWTAWRGVGRLGCEGYTRVSIVVKRGIPGNRCCCCLTGPKQRRQCLSDCHTLSMNPVMLSFVLSVMLLR